MLTPPRISDLERLGDVQTNMEKSSNVQMSRNVLCSSNDAAVCSIATEAADVYRDV